LLYIGGQFVAGIGGLLIYVWSIILSYEASGFLAAVLTALIVPIAQLYWFFAAWSISGTFFNLYTISVLVYVILIVISFLGFVIGEPE